jgi:BirA family biotin operon repressor/biotin-[acetyl-CoA-carboxylase] ligase
VGIEGLNVEAINSKVSRYWSVSVIEETTSTQSDLVQQFESGKVLVAEYQSAGRGRLDRKFIVPPRKGLTFSFCIEATNDFGWIPLLTGLAVAQGINNYLNSDLVKIKWPNDLLIDEKKLGGILSEKSETGVVVGVGINIFQTQTELPISDATSLTNVVRNMEIDRSELLSRILDRIGEVLADLGKFKNEYREFCSTIGKSVMVTLPTGQVIEDLAIGISTEGALLLKSHEITVGDTVHLRNIDK